MTMGDDAEVQQDEAPSDEVSELDLLIDALLIMIRL
jgi:hypothetical protein